MSASATGDGAKEAERVGQLTIPPTITTIRNTSERVPMKAARSPCRASGTRAATEPAVMTRDYIRSSTEIPYFNWYADRRASRSPASERRRASWVVAEDVPSPVYAADQRLAASSARLSVYGRGCSRGLARADRRRARSERRGLVRPQRAR